MNFLNTQISNTPAILHVMLCVCLSQFMHSIDDAGAGARSHFLNTFSFSNVYANLRWNRENMFSFTFDRFVNILFTCECEVGIQVARSTRLEIKTFSRLDKHITSLALDHQTIRETHIGLFLYSTTTKEQIISVAITSLTLFSFKKNTYSKMNAEHQFRLFDEFQSTEWVCDCVQWNCSPSPSPEFIILICINLK